MEETVLRPCLWGENVIKTDFETVRDGPEYHRLLLATALEGGGGVLNTVMNFRVS